MAGFENDVLLCKNINFDPAAAKPHLGIINAAGKLPIGTGATSPTPEILAGSITSPLGTLSIGYSSPNITLDVSGGAQAVEHLTGNIGGQLNPDGSHNFNIVTANSTVKVVGSGSTLTEDFNLTNVVLGSSLPSLTSGTLNVGLGSNVLNGTTSGSGNVAIGYHSGQVITSAVNSTLIGIGSGDLITTSSGNTAVGSSSLTAVTTGNGENTAIGTSSLNSLQTGRTNIAVGFSSGVSYTTTESSNIVIGNQGVLAESHTLRLGTTGTGNGEQNRCFVAGITGATPTSGNTPQVVLCDNLGNLAPISSSTAGFVLTSNGTATPSFQASGGGGTNSTFSAFMTSNVTNVTGDGTNYQLIYDTANVNQGTVLNTSTGVFTAPLTGNYNFSFNMLCSTVLAFTSMNYFLYVNGSPFAEFFGPSLPGTSSFSSMFCSTTIPLSLNDTVTVIISGTTTGNTKNVGIFGGTTLCRFSGFKIA